MVEAFNWPRALKTNLFLLKLAGLWPQNGYELNLYLGYAFTTLGLCLIPEILCQIISILFLENLQDFTNIVVVLLTKVGGIVKLLFFITNLGTVQDLILELGDRQFQPRDLEQVQVLERSVWTWRFFLQLYWALGVCSMGVWASFPVIERCYTDACLPFPSWHPFDVGRPVVYQLVYVYQIVNILEIAMININLDILISALNMCVGAQFDLILANLRAVDGEWSLHRCIQHHRKLLGFTARSNAAYDWIMFTQFFVSTVSLGVITFQVTVIPPFTPQFFGMFFYEFSMFVQIFMLCWFGEEVLRKSDRIIGAIFDCDWLDFPRETKIRLLILSLNCQKPVKLSTLNLFDLSIGTFLAIVRTAWSYFAVLFQLAQSTVD